MEVEKIFLLDSLCKGYWMGPLGLLFKGSYLENGKSYRKSDSIFKILGPLSTKNITIKISVSRLLHPLN